MEPEYRQTQYGALMFAVFFVPGILLALVARAALAEGRWFSTLVMIGLYLFGLVSFYALTVEISAGQLSFWFGIGVIRKSYPLSEIQSVVEVRYPWYYFWGIKSIPGGWFYALAPGDAVEITLRSGKVLSLGTKQPESLRQALERAIKQEGDQQSP